MKNNYGKGCRWDATVRGRIRFLGVLIPMLLILPIMKAFYLQVLEKDSLRERVDSQSQFRETIKPRRGPIIDRTGQPLAISVPVPSVYAIREQVADKKGAAALLAGPLESNRKKLYRRLSRGNGFVWLERKVTPEMAQKVEALGLNGVGIQEESRRYYPNLELAGAVLGFVGTDGGLEGLENSLEKHLKGGTGTRSLSLDARGKTLVTADPEDSRPQAGSTVQLTFDRNIQFFVEQSLVEGSRQAGARASAAVIMESATGRILAMASYPQFNPNDFGKYTQDQFRNRAVNFIYEPGSTFKVITAAAALQEQVFDEMDIIYCGNGKFEVADRTINDHVPHGWLTLTGIIQKSSNIGASKVGLELGKENLGAYIKAFGFGERTGLLVPSESAGILRDHTGWTQVDLANIAFGQGLAVTPLQMLNAVNAIANGGELIMPYMIEKITTSSGEVILQKQPGIVRQVVSENTARKVVRMMETVVEDGGSGVLAAVEGHRVAGKTGTAQKFLRREGRYSENKFIASFVGFAPSDNPAITAIVVVDEPGENIYGGITAAPIWASMVGKTLKYLKIKPTSPFRIEEEIRERQDSRWASRNLNSPGEATSSMPDLRGFTLREALADLSSLSVDIEISGAGIVVGQSPGPGEPLDTGVKLTLLPRISTS